MNNSWAKFFINRHIISLFVFGEGISFESFWGDISILSTSLFSIFSFFISSIWSLFLLLSFFDDPFKFEFSFKVNLLFNQNVI